MKAWICITTSVLIAATPPIVMLIEFYADLRVTKTRMDILITDVEWIEQYLTQKDFFTHEQAIAHYEMMMKTIRPIQVREQEPLQTNDPDATAESEIDITQ